MRLIITVLGLDNQVVHKPYFKFINEYMRQLSLFAVHYCKTRYKLDVEPEYYYPFYTPKSYEELKQWDQTGWRQEHFGEAIQTYVVYGINLTPYSLNANGYCECVGRPELKAEDMLYAEMPAYHELLTKDIYKWYREFSRTFFHELDHQILWLQFDKNWLKGVHAAMSKPLLQYNRGKDKYGQEVSFWTQQDARSQ